MSHSSKKTKRKLVGAAVALTAAAAVLLSGLFSTPNELILDPEDSRPKIVYQLDDADISTEDEESEEDEEKKKGFFTRVKEWIYGLPTFVRVLLGLPLWALGWCITQLAKFLFRLILAPLLSAILTWLVTFLILLLVFYILCRLIWPEMPKREILSKQNIAWILILSGLCCAGNIACSHFWEEYEKRESLLRFAEGLVIEALMLGKVALQRQRLRRLCTAP